MLSMISKKKNLRWLETWVDLDTVSFRCRTLADSPSSPAWGRITESLCLQVRTWAERLWNAEGWRLTYHHSGGGWGCSKHPLISQSHTSLWCMHVWALNQKCSKPAGEGTFFISCYRLNPKMCQLGPGTCRLQTRTFKTQNLSYQ